MPSAREPAPSARGAQSKPPPKKTAHQVDRAAKTDFAAMVAGFAAEEKALADARRAEAAAKEDAKRAVKAKKAAVAAAAAEAASKVEKQASKKAAARAASLSGNTYAGTVEAMQAVAAGHSHEAFVSLGFVTPLVLLLQARPTSPTRVL